jgi:hypothetical protein
MVRRAPHVLWMFDDSLENLPTWPHRATISSLGGGWEHWRAFPGDLTCRHVHEIRSPAKIYRANLVPLRRRGDIGALSGAASGGGADAEPAAPRRGGAEDTGDDHPVRAGHAESS